ncbi:hypothetical protein [Candidatus Minimicrobia naudis]
MVHLPSLVILRRMLIFLQQQLFSAVVANMLAAGEPPAPLPITI